jgi:Amt family ammonium transporter
VATVTVAKPAGKSRARKPQQGLPNSDRLSAVTALKTGAETVGGRPSAWLYAAAAGGTTPMRKPVCLLALSILLLLPGWASAAEAPSNAELKVIADTIWVLLCGALIFWMNAGFALLESGFCRKKNTVNILAKNFIVFAITTLIFYAVGFGIMFGNGNQFVGMTGWFVPNEAELFQALNWTSVPLYAKFFFQLVFAATAATIVSGAVAERIHYSAFLIFSALMGAVIYPVVGHWIWGGGLLATSGMFDFAGSSAVHSVGGWAALSGILFLGPRAGKYGRDGRPMAIPGHNMTSATLGTFILWLGWFGFNPGSTMAANPDAIAHIVLTTTLAAAAGAVMGALYTWLRLGKPDLGLTCNGCLAGLVAITAGCAFVTPQVALLIGALGGVLVVEGVLGFDRLRLDDPVGATSVHLLNGIFGTLCIGLFGDVEVAKSVAGVELLSNGLFFGGDPAQLVAQARGVLIVAVFTFCASSLIWWFLKHTVGIRVSADSEEAGLDQSEMGMEAYPEDMSRASMIGSES